MFKLITLTIIIINLINESKCINLTYIIKKGDNYLYPTCIAEENTRYTGIGWVYPLLLNNQHNLITNISTIFIPINYNDYNCKFEKNDRCSRIWSIINWKIDENSTRTFDLLLDKRWEDFHQSFTSNNTKEFHERIEIPNLFHIGLSMRATNDGELFICEGWNPYNYACYIFIIKKNEIILKKNFHLNSTDNEKILDYYKTYSNILSEDEWRNFIISNDKGVIQLIDIYENRTVIQFKDDHPLKPLYLLKRSVDPTLWKIHQNNFLYTLSPQISRMGPILELDSNDLCVNLFVSSCSHCAYIFFIITEKGKQILKEVLPTTKEKFKWNLIKLKYENIQNEKLNIFVETKFIYNYNDSKNGFWAIDDVRVCHENEIKVTYLKTINNQGIKEDIIMEKISCQLIENPKWRPNKLIYPLIKNFSQIDTSSDVNSIHLNWTTQDNKQNQINYLITYKGNDLCNQEPHNLKRLKSSGFLMTKNNEIEINNLIPYTQYNITIFSILHEQPKQLLINTRETDLPTIEELPNKIQIKVNENNASIFWDNVTCLYTYGRLIYTTIITDLTTNTSKQMKPHMNNIIDITNLKPFTNYSLDILTTRNLQSITKDSRLLTITINFTTKSDIASKIENLELYSSDENSLSFRYNLPSTPKGLPTLLKISRCNSLFKKKCKSIVLPIMRCPLWPQKYCVDINNLISNQEYNFKISIKNDLTHSFGDETNINGFTSENIPGKPFNLTYKFVNCVNFNDYCNLNISWYHPYIQNGTITSFHIILNGTNNNKTENIQDVLKIDSKNYTQQYHYQIKYIPYNSQYELYIQSGNLKYKSDYSNIRIKPNNIGDYIDQSPRLLEKAPTYLKYKPSLIDNRLNKYVLKIIVQDYNKSQAANVNFISNETTIGNYLCHNFGLTWLAADNIEIYNNDTTIITIGANNSTNKYLKPKTKYCITFIITNYYKNTQHDIVYYDKLQTPDNTLLINENQSDISTSNHNYYIYITILLLLILLLIFILFGFFYYYCYKKNYKLKSKTEENSIDNQYESLPFQECEDVCVSNGNYDHLLNN